MSKYLIFFFGLLLLSLIPITRPQAQSDPDGDGVIGRRDLCPHVSGPAGNNGCPVPPTHDPNDSDGDGNPNTADRCPNEGGPASNGGCPETLPNPCPEGFSGQNCSEPAPVETEVFTLPILPIVGNCVLATAGQARVNVRNIPDLAGEVVGQLEPAGVYPLHFHIIGASSADSWYLVDLGWVSAAVVRLGGNCSNVPSLKLPETLILQLGDLGIVFVTDGTSHEPAKIEYPNLDEDSSNEQIPPFLLQACDGSVRVTWLQQDFNFCDGSVIPADQIPNDGDDSAFECDGAFNLLLPAVQMGDGSVMPVPEFLFGLLLPAVKMGDGSVIPAEAFLGDGSVMPCPSANILLGTGGGSGAGKVVFQDIHFIALKNAAGNFGIIILDIPQEGSVGDPFAPFALNFMVDPPDPDMDWTQIGDMLIGHWQGNTYVCPSDPSAEGEESSLIPSSGFEAVGFDPQPDPPAECLSINFANEQ